MELTGSTNNAVYASGVDDTFTVKLDSTTPFSSLYFQLRAGTVSTMTTDVEFSSAAAVWSFKCRYVPAGATTNGCKTISGVSVVDEPSLPCVACDYAHNGLSVQTVTVTLTGVTNTYHPNQPLGNIAAVFTSGGVSSPAVVVPTYSETVSPRYTSATSAITISSNVVASNSIVGGTSTVDISVTLAMAFTPGDQLMIKLPAEASIDSGGTTTCAIIVGTTSLTVASVSYSSGVVTCVLDSSISWDSTYNSAANLAAKFTLTNIGNGAQTADRAFSVDDIMVLSAMTNVYKGKSTASAFVWPKKTLVQLTGCGTTLDE